MTSRCRNVADARLLLAVALAVSVLGACEREKRESRAAPVAESAPASITLTTLSELRGRLVRAMDESPDRAREGLDTLNGIENGLKVYIGRVKALNDPAFTAKLAAAESVEAYFGEELDLKSIVGADELNVFEYVPIIAGGYDIAYGTVTTKIWLATPYEVDEKVAVMIGMVTENADGTNTVSWKAFEGVGIAPESEEAVAGIQTELDPETVLAIQEGVALLAIVSA